MPSERLVFVNWEGRAAIFSRVEAWAFARGSWKSIDPLEVSDSGYEVSAEEFDALFPDLPELPAEAFASSSARDAVGNAPTPRKTFSPAAALAFARASLRSTENYPDPSLEKAAKDLEVRALEAIKAGKAEVAASGCSQSLQRSPRQWQSGNMMKDTAQGLVMLGSFFVPLMLLAGNGYGEVTSFFGALVCCMLTSYAFTRGP